MVVGGGGGGGGQWGNLPGRPRSSHPASAGRSATSASRPALAEGAGLAIGVCGCGGRGPRPELSSERDAVFRGQQQDAERVVPTRSPPKATSSSLSEAAVSEALSQGKATQ
ncbi:Mediator Of Rna polymerase Ii Transcription Subunit 14 [Manis pentadactyla]|nr:Mediator Of Rna polymerase Ii Transcription Subunit 14 [Manis pentadactyla]